MEPLAARIIQSPLAHDPGRAAACLDAIDPSLRQGSAGALLSGAAGSSPYLARLIGRHQDWLPGIMNSDPDWSFASLIDEAQKSVAAAETSAEVGTILRHTKVRCALLAAFADLGGVWSLDHVTAALTALADSAVEAAAKWLLRAEVAHGRLPDPMDADAGAGYMIIAMGKWGAGELNYSSDIDLIALFDDSAFGRDDVLDARARYIHVTRQLVRLLSENTADGYVFRTDLRLRPSPSTTPVCMARDAAERYYESAGRTWERAAHIKARPLVDQAAGQTYLGALIPFVWRRHLDFAAIDDIHGMLRKIREQRAKFGVTALPGRDIKRDPGGIREIEFFAQTRQLIMGGRDPSLRPPKTLDALQALAHADLIDQETADVLASDYRAHRMLEHRLQMIEDAQTHTIPKGEDARLQVAMLSGTDDLAAFESRLSDRFVRVHGLTETFFRPQAAGPAPKVAMDTEDAPLQAFARPADAARHLDRWRDGEIAATRSDRARALYLQLEPTIVEGLGRAANPDQALAQFDRFITGLPAGVQVFSLFSQNLQLLELIISICAAAPKLASYLGRHAQTLDALLDRDFWEPLPDTPTLLEDFNTRLGAEEDYERILDASRRWAREHWFQAGVHVLRGVSDGPEAGAAFTRIAETCITGLLPKVTAMFAGRHGLPPGGGLAVLALGKLGSGEMTAGSDLDLITIYDPGGAEASEGPRPLPPGAYYPRLTQALIAALTAPTAEGALYQVDMRLRPSGNQGPVAVSLSAFESYQRDKAWVWEHLALTRARCVAGPPDLVARIDAIIGDVLAARAGQAAVLDEAASMRTRLIAANQAERASHWSLKHAAGGLMEIEFLAQTGVLAEGIVGCRSAPPAVIALAERGWLESRSAESLREAFDLQQNLQQIERVAIDGPLDPQAIGDELIAHFVRAAGSADLTDLEARLKTLQAQAAETADAVFAHALPRGEGDAD